jgi:hypothetical protein
VCALSPTKLKTLKEQKASTFPLCMKFRLFVVLFPMKFIHNSENLKTLLLVLLVFPTTHFYIAVTKSLRLVPQELFLTLQDVFIDSSNDWMDGSELPLSDPTNYSPNSLIY